MTKKKKQKYDSDFDRVEIKLPKKNYTKIVARSICNWMIFFIPIHAFYLEYTYSEEFYCGGGVYVCDEIINNVLCSTALVIILLLTPQKIKITNIFVIICSLIYIGNYINRCYQIAWQGRILHGNTWRATEVYFTFLHGNILFYLAGLIGLVLFASVLYKRKSVKIDIHLKLRSKA